MEQKSDLLRVVRQKQRETIDSALDECIDAGVMWEFLTNNRDEVAEILLDEWNWNIAIKVAAEEVREKTLCKLVHNGYLTVEQAAGFAGVTKQKLLDWTRQYYGNKEKNSAQRSRSFCVQIRTRRRSRNIRSRLRCHSNRNFGG